MPARTAQSWWKWIAFLEWSKQGGPLIVNSVCQRHNDDSSNKIQDFSYFKHGTTNIEDNNNNNKSVNSMKETQFSISILLPRFHLWKLFFQSQICRASWFFLSEAKTVITCLALHPWQHVFSWRGNGLNEAERMEMRSYSKREMQSATDIPTTREVNWTAVLPNVVFASFIWGRTPATAM